MRFRVPHTLILLFGMLVIATILAIVLPAGTYERDGRRVIPGSFHYLEDVETSVLDRMTGMFLSVPQGFESAQDIIFFVFIIGGAFAVVRATGAVDALLGWVLSTFGRAKMLLIAGTMLVFSVGSSTLGMAEEYMPFLPLLLALAWGLKLDPIVGVAILCIGYGVGYGVAAINPFTVIVAQNVAGVEATSGWGYRVALTVPFFLIGFFHVYRYARKIEKDPSKSLVADLDLKPPTVKEDGGQFTTTHLFVLLATAITIILLVWGIQQHHWYLTEMGGLFLGLTLVIAAIARMSPDKAAGEFCTGAAELTTTALLIGFARSVLIVLEDGQVIDTIVHGIATPLAKLGPEFGAMGMFLVQSLTNLFIPSGSGQAYVTMPIMAPLADLVGIERQVAVLAYQFGDGFTNIIVPTNGVLMGILAMAGIPYDRWLRFLLPFMFQVWIVGSLALAVAVWIGYS